MLTRTSARYLSWPIGRAAALLAATGIPPNVITWSALVANLWAGIFFAAGRFASAGGMMILAGICDLLDGPVARLQGRVSLFGGFLDSILDRYADLILFLGLLIYYVHVNRFSYAFLAGAGAAGAVMVSYAKARAESLVPGPGVGFWERPERLALMILGALVNRMPVALWILAIGPNITVIHNIVHTWQQTERGRKSLADAQSVLGIAPSRLQPKLRPAPEPPRVMTRSAGRGA
ncbi:MAG TPA: CDP-alcohol phosphatidyltransferase family protein [Candidatus Acidoferrales bacterium]|jgi:CDP-diacylglycerol--glycerol-3-phosphate 3-phosphatidyltransferase|nr:CDP-alcohol phosphatidyltransferase family protein [Candidatus Acidoferrales bacterium]